MDLSGITTHFLIYTVRGLEAHLQIYAGALADMWNPLCRYREGPYADILGSFADVWGLFGGCTGFLLRIYGLSVANIWDFFCGYMETPLRICTGS